LGTVKDSLPVILGRGYAQDRVSSVRDMTADVKKAQSKVREQYHSLHIRTLFQIQA
jgi:hypothetical protein